MAWKATIGMTARMRMKEADKETRMGIEMLNNSESKQRSMFTCWIFGYKI